MKFENLAVNAIFHFRKSILTRNLVSLPSQANISGRDSLRPLPSGIHFFLILSLELEVISSGRKGRADTELCVTSEVIYHISNAINKRYDLIVLLSNYLG